MTDEATALLADYDRLMAALCIWREARGEPLLGRKAVWCVLRNRLKSGQWGNTMMKVVTARWQFSAFNSGDPNATLFPSPEDPRWHDCLDIVADYNSPDITNGALYYFNPHVIQRPGWASKMTMTTAIGAHEFFKS
jgi:N-acetylmuramoyl-L-alanine amidase